MAKLIPVGYKKTVEYCGWNIIVEKIYNDRFEVELVCIESRGNTKLSKDFKRIHSAVSTAKEVLHTDLKVPRKERGRRPTVHCQVQKKRNRTTIATGR